MSATLNVAIGSSLLAIVAAFPSPASAGDVLPQGRSTWLSVDHSGQVAMRVSEGRQKVVVAQVGGRDACFLGRIVEGSGYYAGRYWVNGKRRAGDFYYDYDSREGEVQPVYWVERPGGRPPALLHDTWRATSAWPVGRSPAKAVQRCIRRLA